jgi:hypothetical protein
MMVRESLSIGVYLGLAVVKPIILPRVELPFILRQDYLATKQSMNHLVIWLVHLAPPCLVVIRFEMPVEGP